MKTRILLAFMLSLFIAPTFAQKKNSSAQKTEEGYKFTPVVELKATPVKNQAQIPAGILRQLHLLNLN